MPNDEWETPPEIVRLAHSLFGVFDLDVAATEANRKGRLWYSLENDGLRLPWDRKWWCNPPYSRISPWVEKAASAEVPGVMLLPCDSSTRWWQRWVHGEAIIVPITRRIRFVGASGSPTFHSVFALYGWRGIDRKDGLE
jgi:phage N-6-adenine-methyltransferase